MSEREIRKIAIVGAGMMGADIGLEFARFGYEVIMQARHDESLKKAMDTVNEDISLLVETGFISAETARAALTRIRTTKNIEECVSGADHVVEAVPEILTVKQEIFAKLDELCAADVSLATNASGLSVDDCAAKAIKHPERILTTHYWQPAHLIPLVDVIYGKKTSPFIGQKVTALLQGCQKRAVVQEKELSTLPSGWANSMQWVLADKAKKLVDEGCDPRTVDDMIRFGFGRRLAYTGMFLRMDILGIELSYNLAKSRGQELWKPLQKMAERGEFGMASGKGFYDWPDGKAKQFLKEVNTELIRLLKRDIEKGDLHSQ